MRVLLYRPFFYEFCEARTAAGLISDLMFDCVDQ